MVGGEETEQRNIDERCASEAISRQKLIVTNNGKKITPGRRDIKARLAQKITLGWLVKSILVSQYQRSRYF